MPPLRKDHPLAHEAGDPDVVARCQGCSMEIYQCDFDDDWAAIVPGVGALCDSCIGDLGR